MELVLLRIAWLVICRWTITTSIDEELHSEESTESIKKNRHESLLVFFVSRYLFEKLKVVVDVARHALCISSFTFSLSLPFLSIFCGIFSISFCLSCFLFKETFPLLLLLFSPLFVKRRRRASLSSILRIPFVFICTS